MIENISVNPELAAQLPKTFANITGQCDIIKGNIYNYMNSYPQTIFWFLLAGWLAMLTQIYLPMIIKNKFWFKQWRNEIDKGLNAAAFIFVGMGVYQMIPLTFKLTENGIKIINNVSMILVAALALAILVIIIRKKKIKQRQK